MILLPESGVSFSKKGHQKEKKPKTELIMLKIIQPKFIPKHQKCKLNNTESDKRIVIDHKSVVISLQESTQDTSYQSSINYSKFMLERWQRINSKLPLVD